MRCVALAVLAAIAVALAGCGSAPSTRIDASTLSVYTSLPLRGDRAAESRAIVRGEKLALKEFGGEIGGKQIGFVVLDDTEPDSEGWTPAQAGDNARTAVNNPTTVAFIGDTDSGATAVSLPITNEAGILQVSPASVYTGLTRLADKGEPEKYYPSHMRTFARLTPNGLVEARALSAWLERIGAERVAIVADERQDGQGAVRDLSKALESDRLDIIDDIRVSQRSDDVSKPVKKLRELQPDAIVYAGASPDAAARLLRGAHAALPSTPLFVTSAAAQDELARQLGDAAATVRVLSPILPPRKANEAAQRMSRRYRLQYGEAPPPAALYGYEAMRSVLQAIKDVGKRNGDKEAVIARYFDGRPRASVLGRYRIGREGDTTLQEFGLYRVGNRGLELERRLDGGSG